MWNINSGEPWVALMFDHHAEVKYLPQATCQRPAHHLMAFVLFDGRLALVFALYQDHMAVCQKQHIGLSAEHPSHIACLGLKCLVGDALS